MTPKLKILIFCEEFHQKHLTGPQKRKFQLYVLLSLSYDVTLAISNSSCSVFQDMKLLSLQDVHFSQTLSSFDIIVVSPQSFESTPMIDHFNGKIIVDLYIPSIIEHQYTFTEQDQLQQQFFKDQSLYYKAFSYGNLFLCANDAQLHFYQGMMTAMGRLIQNQCFIKVPFFAESKNISKVTSHPLKIAWIGGFWNWFYPEPFLEQIPEIIQKTPDIEIHFVGIDHPFAKFPLNQKAIQQVQLLQNKFPNNLFIQSWIDGQQYLDFLQGLDVVILLTKFQTEEEYSIRTRLFEILESQIPVVLNSNDELARLISSNNLGVQVDTKSSISFFDVISKVVSTSKQRKWQTFFNQYDKKEMQSRLTDAIKSLSNTSKTSSTNPYFIQKLKWNHKLIWKLKRLQKLGFSKTMSKVFQLFKP